MSQPPSYAPTSTTSYTVPTTNYHKEVTRASLISSPLHKDVYNSLAEIYSILSVLELIENSYIKDYITDKEKYTSTSLRLINQYQIIVNGFKEDQAKIDICNALMTNLNGNFDEFLECFSQMFNPACPLAIKRLTSGVPVTIRGQDQDIGSQMSTRTNSTPVNGQSGSNQNARLIAEATSNFITCMDALKLNYKHKDQLHPLLSELVINLNELTEDNNNLDFHGKSKLITWLIKLNNLQDKELPSEEIEEFLNDLNIAYKNFYSKLE
ncbi:Vacuolar protein-sorting-associated protein 28 [Yamadazyma tenuis]|uniref:Vacuolar protein sorting-associated protein 28 n=1 Tax=Candida tenuis (strain ATCC 10573 / BCRC 21748 / CBS 615 / JCM 9827 / NBRC 10315 / NRRL Y-1498 / VKM Y-70) TaxID=590646 RepID=G3BEP7_CANTC|nr:ESCRT-1 complex, Vps28 subunit [Yamadazyma tenuis ATCC 10573]EGV59943.1 ESCRT-1 complex, Vps28 subunit [Yamadazyma tenuis ATCC 10573]WEJ94831.1 Vacuolar protein-sorting-associated protein 28 [Yamadazyma tenuis]